ncbi:MAG TPA: aspartate kinase [Candidatus Solibacter sp.]|nr:aspartate kinase [Candidatus Solibacter sp.]
MKFGGTSVEDAVAIRRVIGIVRSKGDSQLVIVVSALARVTDQLLEAGRAASAGHLGAALATARNIYVRYEKIADELVEHAALPALEQELRKEFRELEALLLHLERSRQLDIGLQDRLLGFGECLSSHVVQAALSAAGVHAAHIDARRCIVTDAKHGQASPLWDETNLQSRDLLVPLLESGQIPVLGGFIAATADGVPTTLGRGGSDFSAAILGAALGASRIEIWTDVDGVMTADPKLCPDARVIRKMSFDEAAELAHFGAKVLHPATLAPAMRENIPVYVLNSRNPEGDGTEILARARTGQLVGAITSKRNVASVEIDSAQAVNSALLRAVYDVFYRHSCPVDLMATSLGHISLVVGATSTLPAAAADLENVARVRWENHKALVCLVGENIRRQPDIAHRAFAAVSDLSARVVCQGASERTISFLVEEERVEESVQRLHALFFPQQERLSDWGGISTAYCQAG